MISNRIKSARKYRKLTQEELAKKINSTKSTISNYENSYSSPSAEVISMLADALETSTDYLLEKTDEIENKQKYYDLTKKDENDIEKELEKILSNLDSSDGLAFSGEP
ncbi:helix-turn-helix transcriptional regulator, partial [Listeria monocytogenes]|nr:helix-turn-helix transcriptional regulator [Listeria monocytogenes]